METKASLSISRRSQTDWIQRLRLTQVQFLQDTPGEVRQLQTTRMSCLSRLFPLKILKPRRRQLGAHRVLYVPISEIRLERARRAPYWRAHSRRHRCKIR